MEINNKIMLSFIIATIVILAIGLFLYGTNQTTSFFISFDFWIFISFLATLLLTLSVLIIYQINKHLKSTKLKRYFIAIIPIFLIVILPFIIALSPYSIYLWKYSEYALDPYIVFDIYLIPMLVVANFLEMIILRILEKIKK